MSKRYVIIDPTSDEVISEALTMFEDMMNDGYELVGSKQIPVKVLLAVEFEREDDEEESE